MVCPMGSYRLVNAFKAFRKGAGMSGTFRVGFPIGTARIFVLRSIVRMLVIPWLTMMILMVNGSAAHAQLRTGRVDRRLYQDELAAARTPVKSRRDSSVAPASFSEAEEHSVLEPESEIYEADDWEVVSGGQVDYGCDGMGCDSGCHACGPGYSTLAPTCLSLNCSPGCGPLMALWYRMKVRTEVPLFWRRGQAPLPLVTTSPPGTDAGVAGELGQSTTTTLLGNSVLNESSNAGFRLTLGTWLDPAQRYHLMFRYWNAGDQDDTFNFDSNSFSILARPFLNTTVAGAFEQDTQLVAFPGESTGSISVATTSSVDGLELTLRRLLYLDRFTRVDWLYGYQHVSIEEGLTISSNTTVTGNVPALQGNIIAVTDRFETTNDFHGASYGIMSSRRFADWKMESMFRLGLGNLRRRVNIDGTTSTTSSGVTSTTAEGLLARNTNNRPFVDDTFVVIPEVGINFAYQLRPGFDFNFGYNYMLIPKVAQAAQQLDNDLAVNLSDPLTGSIDPQLDFDERNYWLHSLGLGFQLRY